MPTYVYRCVTCGQLTEFGRPMNSSAEPDACRKVLPYLHPRQQPECGGLLVRSYTPPALVGVKP